MRAESCRLHPWNIPANSISQIFIKGFAGFFLLFSVVLTKAFHARIAFIKKEWRPSTAHSNIWGF